MKKSLFIFILLCILCAGSYIKGADTDLYEWNSTLKQFDSVVSAIGENPVSPRLGQNLRLLLGLSSAVGVEKTVSVIENTLKKVESAGGRGSGPWFMLVAALAACEDSRYISTCCAGPGLWNISGPWNRYGSPDFDYPFPPETDPRWKNFTVKKIADEGEGFFPYSKSSGSSGVIYAKTLFGVNSAVRVMVISDAVCRIFINGRDQGNCRVFSGRYISALRLSGSAGYNVMLKFYHTGKDLPRARLFITGDDGNIPEIIKSADVRTSSPSVEQLLASATTDEGGFPGSNAADEISALTGKGSHDEALSMVKKLLRQYPGNYFLYREYARLLCSFRMENELLNLVSEFTDEFPDSKEHFLWLAEYYRGSDISKFITNIEKAGARKLDPDIASAYIKALVKRGETQLAEQAAEKYVGSMPERLIVLADAFSAAGKRKEMRDLLIKGAALTDDARIYLLLGCADEAAGLDPVIYWTKCLESEEIFCDASDMIDIFENSDPGGNTYYTGRYTEERVEFRYDGIIRNISLHVFESGSCCAKVTDYIPRKLLLKSTSDGTSSYRLPVAAGINLLYALKVDEGSVSPVVFKPRADASGGWADVTLTGECSYIILEYSCKPAAGEDGIKLAELPVIATNEFVEKVDIEISCYGIDKPGIIYNGNILKCKKTEGKTISSADGSYKDSPSETVMLTVSKFRSFDEFASWYDGLVRVRGVLNGEESPVLHRGKHLKETITSLNSILSGIAVSGETDFSPGSPESVLKRMCGSPEEKALLAMALLQKAGIKSCIAFGISSDGSRINKNEVLLYVPEDGTNGFWISMSEGLFHGNVNKTVVIMFNGKSRVMQVSPDRVIKE